MSQHYVTLAFSFLCETFFETILSCWRNIPLHGKVKTVMTGLRGQNPVIELRFQGLRCTYFCQVPKPGQHPHSSSGWRTVRATHDRHPPGSGHCLSAHLPRWPLGCEGVGQAALSVGVEGLPLECIISVCPPFLSWSLRGLIWLQRENVPACEITSDGSWANFCPSCTGSDLNHMPKATESIWYTAQICRTRSAESHIPKLVFLCRLLSSSEEL